MCRSYLFICYASATCIVWQVVAVYKHCFLMIIVDILHFEGLSSKRLCLSQANGKWLEGAWQSVDSYCGKCFRANRIKVDKRLFKHKQRHVVFDDERKTNAHHLKHLAGPTIRFPLYFSALLHHFFTLNIFHILLQRQN